MRLYGKICFLNSHMKYKHPNYKKASKEVLIAAPSTMQAMSGVVAYEMTTVNDPSSSIS